MMLLTLFGCASGAGSTTTTGVACDSNGNLEKRIRVELVAQSVSTVR